MSYHAYHCLWEYPTFCGLYISHVLGYTCYMDLAYNYVLLVYIKEILLCSLHGLWATYLQDSYAFP